MCTNKGRPILSWASGLICSHHPVNLDGGSHSPDGIVFMGPGYPKQGHHRIPSKFVYGAFVFGNDFGNLSEEMAGEVFDFFRIQAFR